MRDSAFFLIGNSHAICLAVAARKKRIPFHGGPLTAGEAVSGPACSVEGGRFRLLDPTRETKLREYLDRFSRGIDLLDIGHPIVSTFGFNTQEFIRRMRCVELSYEFDDRPGAPHVSRQAFDAIVTCARTRAIDFYRALRERGLTVYCLCPPQRFALEDVALGRAFEGIVMSRIAALGVHLIDVRARTMDADGLLREEFLPARRDDRVHANAAFGAIVIDQLVDEIGWRPKPGNRMSRMARRLTSGYRVALDRLTHRSH